jgi:simple sugar transport system ATP-binding protein
MQNPPVLELRQIEKAYFGTTVLRAVDLELRPGEVHALLGENGAGKSTLMNILFGMPVIAETGGFSGEIRLDGETVVITAPKQAMDLGIGMVHQEFMLIPGFAVYENIKLNREPRRGLPWARLTGPSLDLLDRDRMRAESRAALSRVHLTVDERTPVGALPVGHQQFVEIAREVDKSSMKVLVFDEPTAVLAESEAEALLQVMRDLAAEGIAILFITHRLDEVMAVADTVTILRDGERVSCTPREETSVPEIAELMVGRELAVVPSVPSEIGPESNVPVALSVSGLEVRMPGEEVRGVDLEVREGEIFGIGGLAGQGKIGIANGIMGLAPATGSIRVMDRPLRLNSPRHALREGLAFVSEDRRGVGLLLDESLETNIAVPAIELHGRFLRWRFLGPLALLDRKTVRAHAADAIRELDIRTTGPGQVVRRLSGGNQQKVCLARALVLAPRILLVSEPTRGVDVGAKELILDHLRKLNRDEGLTILMTSSELGELRSLCHRIAIVTEGRIVGTLPPDAPDVQFGLLMSGGEA